MKIKFLILILGIFGFFGNSFAISYNGSASFSMPDIKTSTGKTIYPFTESYVGSASNIFNSYIESENPLYSMRSMSFGVAIHTGGLLSFSGILATLLMYDNYTNHSNEWGYISVIDFRIEPSPTGDKYYVDLWKGTSIGAEWRQELVGSYYQFTNNALNCSGLSSDCVLVIQPRIYLKEGTGQGEYLAYIDYSFFSINNKVLFFRNYFGDLTANGPNPTFWESTKAFLGLGVTGYGQLVTDVMNSLDPSVLHLYPQTNLRTFQWIANENTDLKNDTIMADFIRGHMGGNFEVSLPDWLSVTGGVSDWTTIDGSGSTDYFKDCGAANFSCYIMGTWNMITDKIGSFFPNISFSGYQDTCASGSTASGSYMQKLANVIAIINPIPPDNEQIICTMFISDNTGIYDGSGTGKVLYHRFIPEVNIFSIVIPGLVPKLERSSIVFGGQNIFDIFVIVVIVMTIIYKRNPHD